MAIQESYTKNYLKIYMWMAVATVVNFISMFIVTPKITQQPVIYGVYMVCVSTTIFLSYADLGFLGAASKYMSECFARKELQKETNILGFVSFILLVCILVYMSVLLMFAYDPHLLIKNLTDQTQFQTARKLLLIMACFAPIIVFQRCISILFSVRLEDYILQRINIISNLLKILSIYYFFRSGHNDLVGYFFLSQCLIVFVTILSLVIAAKRYQFNFLNYLKSIRFSKEIFDLTKGLAFSSLFTVIAWILYYELDSMIIGKLLGPTQLAYYAIGLSLMTIFRTIFGVLYTPFSARLNHFIGTSDNDGLAKFFLKIIFFTMPIVIIPVLAVIIEMRPFIMCWVGNEYTDSIFLAQLMIASYFLSFVSYPGGILLVTLRKIHSINWLNAALLVVYWGGIGLTLNIVDIRAFALFKLISFIFSGIVYLVIILKMFNKEFVCEVKNSAFSLAMAIVVLCGLLFPTRYLLPVTKDKLNLFTVIGIITIGIIISWITCVLLNTKLKNELFGIYNRITKK